MAKFEPRGADLYIDDKKVIGAWESVTAWYWFATEIWTDPQKLNHAEC